jgi:Zn-dependent M28 family amino/carboxypeptidase
MNGTMTWDNLPTVPDIKLNEHQYRIIEQKARERQYFILEFDIRNHFRMGPIKYHNVLAFIRGTDYPEEYIITGGHLDSYDVATGGVDCGTGVAPAMEAARLISKAMAETGAKPKRTIMFALWTGEEAGLLGSKHWVESNRDKWPNIINYFNRDGGPTVASSMTVPSSWVKDMEKVAAPLATFNPEFPFRIIERTGDPPARPTTPGGSDHAYFMINGIPAISFATTDPKGYNFSYAEIWHTERDTYDKSIPEYKNQTSVVNAVILWGMANLEQRLPAKGVYRD